ncbi:universal stress protein UspA-like protein [Beggiatoa alba B18LD]|uniref:Universal stress protein UspA-like protein n=1 Tax=Beggiatoa alba B18LD TaxID=395493 RepID=I3CE61_9GAMM|nr:universal stress protein [Beggiatoa alba]EIJ41904.1 universal stress protein UspA-like protein [Beggiatoa alba B18LD]
MITNILVAIDGSEHAIKAFDLACDLAVKYHAQITAVYVIENFEVPSELRHFAEVEHLSTDAYTLHYKVISENVTSKAKKLAVEKGVSLLETKVLEGNPAQKIVEFAESNAIDTIIMGSRGLGTFTGLIQGSVSSKVSHLAKCTCISVK